MLKDFFQKDKPLTDRERKNLSILELTRREGPITKTEISKQVQLNIVTVSNYVNHYIERNLVFEKGFDVSEGGRRPVLIELNADAGYIVGIGLNTDSIVGVLTNFALEVVKVIKRPRPSEKDMTACMNVMVSVAEELIEHSGVNKDLIRGIGVGVPGIIDEREKTVRWSGLKLGMKDILVTVSVEEVFSHRFGIPTIVENDATAAVFAERCLGIRSEVDNMIYMFSGVGCGIIINGQIYHGASGCAGEIGIFCDAESTDEQRAEEANALGRWTMDVGILERARRVTCEDVPWSLSEKFRSQPDQVSLQEVFDAAKNGDDVARKLVEFGANNLGRKIAFICNLLNPEIVVIGGGLEQGGAIFMDAVKASVKKWSFDEVTRGIRIVPSQFGEKEVALGSACVVAHNVFKNA